jgi:hypothetical protein
LRFAWEAGVPLTDTGTLAVDEEEASAGAQFGPTALLHRW